jgi:hypothetical protein
VPTIGDPQRFAFDYQLGTWRGEEIMSFWACGRSLGEVNPHVTADDMLAIFEGILSERGRRLNPRLFAIETMQLADLFDLVFFRGATPEVERLANEEQWARHHLELCLLGPEVFLVEDGAVARLILNDRDTPAWECRLAAGELDDVLQQAVEILTRARERPEPPR